MLPAAARIDLAMYLTLYRRSYNNRVALLSDDLLAARETACDNRGITRSQKVRDAAWFELGAGQVMHGGHGSVSLLAGKAVSASRGEIGHRGGRPRPSLP